MKQPILATLALGLRFHLTHKSIKTIRSETNKSLISEL